MMVWYSGLSKIYAKWDQGKLMYLFLQYVLKYLATNTVVKRVGFRLRIFFVRIKLLQHQLVVGVHCKHYLKDPKKRQNGFCTEKLI